MNQEIRAEYLWALVAVLAAGLVGITVSTEAGAFTLAFAVLGWWVWLNPSHGLLLFIVIAPLLSMFKVTQTIGIITLAKDVIIVTLFVRLVLLPLFNKTLPYRRNVFIWPIIALGLWTLAAAVRSDQRVLGVLRARDIGLYVLLYFAVLYLPKTKEWYWKMFKWLMAITVITAGLGLYQLWFAPDSAVLRLDPARSIWIPRMSSVFGHPTVLGHFLVSVAALLWAYVLTVKKRAGIALVGLAAIAPFVYLTYSRAVWAAFVASLAVMAAAWAYRRREQGRKKINGLTLAGISLGVFLLIAAVARFTSAGVFLKTAFDPAYASNSDRINYWTRLVSPMTDTEALVGRGLGDVAAQNFREATISSFDLASGASRTVQVAKDNTLVDNQYLKTFVEMGFLGLLIYAWIYLIFWRTAWRLMRTPAAVLGFWGAGFITVFVVQALFVDIWDVFPANAMFWIVAALLSGAAAGGQQVGGLDANKYNR